MPTLFMYTLALMEYEGTGADYEDGKQLDNDWNPEYEIIDEDYCGPGDSSCERDTQIPPPQSEMDTEDDGSGMNLEQDDSDDDGMNMFTFGF